MKRIFTFLIVILLIGNVSFAQQRAINKDGNYKNVIRVKVSKNAVTKFEALHQKDAKSMNKITMDSKGSVKTNIKALDAVNSLFKAAEYKRVFRYAGKFEQKHREFGLHQWYDVSFNSKSSVNDLLKAYSKVADIMYALPIAEKTLYGLPPTRSLSAAPNDPKFSDQWHYENTGQNSGTPGADISLLQAWELETGNSNVIVAIEDQGVDFDHPDLAGNMWINSGEIAGNGYDDDNNGYVDDIYGYNFGDGQGTINPGDHGTHVAGTVAAETNNGIGVAGIAGGTGNNDGVRIMSVEVFGTSSQGGFAEGFVYAADMGAHISQNSWGGGGEDQSINDAIDYFIANGGSAGSPMQGGVVIIAAGNSNTSTGTSTWPAAYPNAIAVAATNKNDAKSYYSNYGTWVDISAPGGELESSNYDPTAIHSTYNNGAYGVMQGTSMACPHVSGVAALIVSRFAGNITPSQVRDRLIDNTDNIDSQIPSYLGKMGSGRLNAFASLGGSVVVDTEAPTAPTALVSSNITDNSVVLNWNASTDNIGVTGYDIYRNGAFLLSTSGISYTVTGLSAITTYSFYVKAKDAAGNTSNASNTISVTTSEIVPIYCESKGKDFSYEWIAGVQIGTYSKTSAGTAYSDFTSEIITLEAGASVNIVLTPGFKSSTYNEYWKIWIDYNGDKDFDDANELAFDAGSMSKTVVNGTINILATASGTTRMRVSMKYNGAQTACETLDYGEVEDYTVTFGDVIPDTEAPSVPSGLSASNITNSSATISWNASTDNVEVTGYDVFRDGSFLGSVTGTSYSATGLSAATTYVFTVKAKDEAGNISAASNGLSVTTIAAGNNLTLTITFDNYPEETSWTLKNSGGSTVASGGTYASQADGSTLVIPINDLPNGCYDFTILDAYGDGICCSYGNGSYKLEVTDGALLASGGSFTTAEVTNFCIPATSSYGYSSIRNNVDGKSSVIVYPNPASSFIKIDVLNGRRVGTIRIFDTYGDLIKTLEMNGNEKEVDVSELVAGLYTITIEDEKDPIVIQFIKK